jgi:DNA-binding NtrC family response regulator/tetratricopeptide (TPR) repeat protein
LAALERGQGAAAAALLSRALQQPGLRRDDQLQVRVALAEAYLLQDDLHQAQEVLGPTPDELRERLEPGRLSALWRLHGRIAMALGEPSRAIALLGKALRQAERAHDSRAIGLAHYELGLCYRQVGDTAIVREHITKAASALHAAGDRRHLAMVHSLSGVALAQEGRFDEAMAALRQAERLAALTQADDVAAVVFGNQANVAMIQHRHEQALSLGERSVALHEQAGTPHGLGVALASLGQFCVRLGNLERAEQVLHRALDVRSPLQFLRETTGAVFDTLAQIHLIRGDYDQASACLRRSREAYGEPGQTSRWYEWSIRVLEARLAFRRGLNDEAIRLADEIAQAADAPVPEALEAEIIAGEALLAADRQADAEARLVRVETRLDPGAMAGVWGEYLRLRGRAQSRAGRATEAYHDFAQSVSVFDLLGERYQAGLSRLALGELAAAAGARSKALRFLAHAVTLFEGLGARPDLEQARRAEASIVEFKTGQYVGPGLSGEDALVRRLVDAAVIPDLLSRETVQALVEACEAESSVVFVQTPGVGPRVVAHTGCDAAAARAVASSAVRGVSYRNGSLLVEPLGRAADGPRNAVVASPRPFGAAAQQRFRTICAVARQGFDLCAARDRQPESVSAAADRPLEPLLPGFVCASPAMTRVAEQIQRMQGNDLTVLVTGESGTGKDLVARAIHAGSPRAQAMFLPYNCTTTTRELADSQLFGHRRGSFTGAVADQLGVLRSAVGGTLFLDEIGDLPLDVQPKLLRFLEQGEVLPVGETRPLRVDVRVVAATNADLEQRVAEGRFREDLFYRLSVIRITVPPLRERREEIPLLATFFLREASERLSKPDVTLSAETLDLFDEYPWPGNVRQLRNEIQRAVAMAPAGGMVRPEHLSAAFSPLVAADRERPILRGRRTNLAAAVEKLEREMIRGALERSGGNISETARDLGLTRRGLYLKLRRLGLEARV